jgi:hypothetical protein
MMCTPHISDFYHIYFKHGSAETKRISIADSRKGGRRGGKWRRGKASGKGEEQGEGEKGRGKEI